MKSDSYLLCRNGVYYVRLYVPRPMQSHGVLTKHPELGSGVPLTFSCRLNQQKREFVYSLKTKSLAQARLRRLVYVGKVEELRMKSVNDLSGENVAMEWKKELDSLHTAQYWNKQAKKAETHAEIALVMGVYSADDYTPATKRISYSTRRGGLVL